MYNLGIFSTFRLHGFTPFSSLLLLPTIFSSLAGRPLAPGSPPITHVLGRSLLTHSAKSLTALRTRHGHFCTRTGRRTGVTLRSDEQRLQPRTSNPNESHLLFLYLQSVPYTRGQELLPQIRFHSFVGHLKNCDLMRWDLGENSEDHFPKSGLLCKGILLLLGLSRCSQLQIPAFSSTIILILL